MQGDVGGLGVDARHHLVLALGRLGPSQPDLVLTEAGRDVRDDLVRVRARVRARVRVRVRVSRTRCTG